MTERKPEIFDTEDEPLSPASNPHICDVIARRLSRRAVLGGLAATGAAGAFAALPLGRQALAAGASTLGFKSLPLRLTESHAVAEGYRARVLIRWGDPVAVDTPTFDPGRQSAKSQGVQFGYNCDFLAYFPLPAGSNESGHGLLWVNHEYTNGELMRAGFKDGAESAAAAAKDWTEVEIAAHGGSVIEVRQEERRWRVVHGSRFARRITAETEMRLVGPAAGHERMKTAADPSGLKVLGTLNNCAGGKTPWGTALTGEENVNAYFAGQAEKSGREARNHRRFGIPQFERARYGWARHHDRFNVDKEPNEPNRFGWIVEIDPYDPNSVPVKRTALGRIKHEGATCVINTDGRIVVYTGDDQAGEYIYKFVSARRFDPGNRSANAALLDDGMLYAARFNEDGSLDWLELAHGKGKLTAENGFASPADVLIEARSAADLVGATRMDRPEDIEANPVTGKVYAILTNNAARGERWPVDSANPRAKNTFGHIIEIVPPGGAGRNADHAAARATWNIFLLAGNPSDPQHRARYHTDQAETGVWLATPDNCAFTPQGHIAIATDQGSLQVRTGIADGLYLADAEGDGRALLKLLFAGPIGAEVCGPEFTPDGRTLFVAVQHPGEGKGSTFDQPTTRWPDFAPGMPPRPSVVAITREDGREIGS